MLKNSPLILLCLSLLLHEVHENKATRVWVRNTEDGNALFHLGATSILEFRNEIVFTRNALTHFYLSFKQTF